MLRRSPLQTCRRHYPGGTVGCDRCRSPVTQRRRPSPSLGWVGSRIDCFEACSAFTHVTACLLAESPKRPFPSKASAVSLPPRPLRLLPAGATVAGWDLHPLKNDTFARRTQKTGVRIATPPDHPFLGLAKRSQLALPDRFRQGELVPAEHVDVVEQQRREPFDILRLDRPRRWRGPGPGRRPDSGCSRAPPH